MKEKSSLSLWIIILLIALLFLFLRFYNLDHRIIFDWDQEQYSTQIRQIVQDHDLVLLGPRTTNDRGFFLGPYFTYLLVPFYLITGLHPSALIYFIVFYNLIFFGCTFFVIRKLFGQPQALSFLLLYALISLLVVYDTLPWWPIFIPLGVISTWFVLYKIYKEKDKLVNYAILGFVLGLFVNMHFQFIFLILFSLFFLAINRHENRLTIKKSALMIGAFLTTFIPLILFDLRHDFLNSKLFFNFFATNSVGQPYDPNVWRDVFTNFLQPLIYLKSQFVMIIFYVFLLFLFIYLYKRRQKFMKSFYFSSLLLWLLVPLFFLLYGKRPSEYYFVFLYPFIIIALTDFIYLLRRGFLIFPLALLIFIINLGGLKFQLQPNPLGMYYKDKAIKELKMLIDPNKKVKITFDTPLGLNSGFNYLINYYHIRRGEEGNIPLIEIRNPPHKGDIKINGAIGLKIPESVKKK